MTYNVAPCALCPKLLHSGEIKEAVYWLPKLEWGLNSVFIFDIVPDYRFAHRACWKALSEKRRRSIRKCSEKRFGPRSLEQFV